MSTMSGGIVLRLGVDAHHAQAVVGNSLGNRVFRERFPYFKYSRAKSESSLHLESRVKTVGRKTF